MNNPEGPQKSFSREEVMSALFANMIIQHTNMALMFLGRVPHPETGQTTFDLESARFFIDQLEMLEVKTAGNLNRQEEGMLKQSLTTLRMVFVEAVRDPNAQPQGAPAQEPAKTAPAQDASPPEAAAEEESRKKFSKKY